MQDEAKILYKCIAQILKEERVKKGIKYTDICYENDIPMSTYDDVMGAKYQATFYNIFKIIRGLGMDFEQFGKLLDENLPQSIWDLED